jgi:enterochelin esterase family protein
MLGSLLSSAQTTPAVESPEVQPGGKIIFRLLDANAKELKLHFEGEKNPLPMMRDDAGVWSATVGPLDPDIYAYQFIF